MTKEDEDLFAAAYEQLRKEAARQMREERDGHTLQPTALVNQVYLRLCGGREINIRDRASFLQMAATAMRHTLVDHARTRASQKRGGDRQKVTLDGSVLALQASPVDVVDLDDALEQLGRVDARWERVVELRFFGGLEVKEVALALQVSERTVANDWQFARAWLRTELAEDGSKT